MKKTVRKISTIFLVLVLSVSIFFSSTFKLETKAAAVVPVAYTAWEILVTVFALVGVSLAFVDHVDNVEELNSLQESAARELCDDIAEFKVIQGGKTDNDGDDNNNNKLNFVPEDWIKNNKLEVPEEDLELLKDYYKTKMAPDPEFTPISGPNVSGISYTDFRNYIIELYDLPVDGIDRVSYLNNFISTAYNRIYGEGKGGFIAKRICPDSDPNSIFELFLLPITYDYYGLGSDSFAWGNTTYYGYNKTYTYFLCNKEPYYFEYSKYTYVSFHKNGTTYNGGANYMLSTHNLEVPFFIVHNQLYDFDSVFIKPVDTSGVDLGNLVYLTDFEKSQNNLSNNFTDNVNKVGDTGLSTLLQNDSFDVVGNGREWDDEKKQVSGGISVTMPDQDKISDFQNGNVPYEDFIGDLGFTPVDTSTGTNLQTGEVLETQKGILGVLNSIWNWLCSFFDNLFEVIVSALKAVFVPRDGFIESKISDFQNGINGTGIGPYNIADLVGDDAENPFKDITIEVYGQEVVIVSFQHLPMFLDKFRPIIRGFLFLLMVYFVVDQLLGLFGLSGLLKPGKHGGDVGGKGGKG